MKIFGLILTAALLAICYAASEEEYCSYCIYHTMCGTTNEGSLCEKLTSHPLNKTDIEKVLNAHNSRRNKVALGYEKRGSDGPQPSAANMMKMEWDEELAEIAQRLTEQCFYGHDCRACSAVYPVRFQVGQNIAARYISRDNYPDEIDIVSRVERWYEKEVGDMKMELLENYRGGNGVGHYSQYVWWNTRLVGCGASVYHGYTYSKKPKTVILVACNYANGNTRGEKIYLPGAPASQCPTGTAATDANYHGLCVIQSPPSDGRFHTDNQFLNYGPNTFLSKPTCDERSFRLYEESDEKTVESEGDSDETTEVTQETEVTEVTEETEVTEVTDVTEVTEVTEVTDVTEVTEVTDVTEVTEITTEPTSITTTEQSSGKNSMSFSNMETLIEFLKSLPPNSKVMVIY